MVDMPYWSFHVSTEQAIENAGRFVHEANAEVMKCEGNRHHAKNIEAIVQAGIPVQGHIGITPMRMPQLGGFVAQGKSAKRAKEMVDDAKAFVDAGCFSILCEVTTSEVAEYLAQTLPVPVISLGAGNCAHGVHIISLRPFPPVGGTRAAPLAHLHRPHSNHGRRDHAVHEGCRQPQLSGAERDRVHGPRQLLAFAKDMKWERKIEEVRQRQSGSVAESGLTDQDPKFSSRMGWHKPSHRSFWAKPTGLSVPINAYALLVRARNIGANGRLAWFVCML